MIVGIKATKPTLRVMIKEPGKEIYQDEIPMTSDVINSYLGENWGVLAVMKDVAVIWPTAGKAEKGASGFTNETAAPGLPNCEIFGHRVYGTCIIAGYNWAKEQLDDLTGPMLEPGFCNRYIIRKIGGKR